MTNSIIEHAARRLTILDGIKEGLAHSKIASKLGISRSVLKKDLNMMRHKRDPKLKQAYKKSQERVQAKKQAVANLPGEKFQRMTGMTFKEKSFNNMMSFYGPELRKILKAENEGMAIIDLSLSVRRTLNRNGILVKRSKSSKLTNLARVYLTGSPLMVS